MRLMRRLSSHPVRNLLIVPGGGPFADTVRAAHAQHQLSERAAHHMALLSMQTMAVALTDGAPGFVMAEHRSQFEAAWGEGNTPVWMPVAMALAAADIPQSWSMTSDSLAAWLADEIEADRLVLVKSCTVQADGNSAQALSQAGVVDACFAQFVEGRRFAWQVVSGVEAALNALC
jgi:5-(aminomethyl)-3-furanmethanol phosphate kinase